MALKNKVILYKKSAVIIARKRDGSNRRVIVDKTDLPIINKFATTIYVATAYTTKYGTREYARVSTPRPQSTTMLHRLLLGYPRNLIDHKNHNGLDNRRRNIRNASHSLNGLNRQGIASHNKTGERGVVWHENEGKWKARLRREGKAYYLGTFEKQEDAAKAVQKALREWL